MLRGAKYLICHSGEAYWGGHQLEFRQGPTGPTETDKNAKAHVFKNVNITFKVIEPVRRIWSIIVLSLFHLEGKSILLWSNPALCPMGNLSLLSTEPEMAYILNYLVAEWDITLNIQVRNEFASLAQRMNKICSR